MAELVHASLAVGGIGGLVAVSADRECRLIICLTVSLCSASDTKSSSSGTEAVCPSVGGCVWRGGRGLILTHPYLTTTRLAYIPLCLRLEVESDNALRLPWLSTTGFLFVESTERERESILC